MDNELYEQVKEAEQQGWLLCSGCIHQRNDDENSPCITCPIEERKRMGRQLKTFAKEGNENVR